MSIWHSGIPRIVEVPLAFIGLVLVAPLLGIAWISIRLTCSGPALFRQSRMGQGGRLFTLYKLRTMVTGLPGSQVTSQDDPRITPVGQVLRKFKIDELPELWNVVVGHLSLVGPRPEVPYYVDLTNLLWQKVLTVKPGLVDPVTLRLRNEEALMQAVTGDRDAFYRNVLLPYKLHGYISYLKVRSAWQDIRVLLATILIILFPTKMPPPTLEEIISSKSDDN